MSGMQPDPTPVVLLHGWGTSYATTWRGSELEKSLRDAGRSIVELDLPGHGAGAVSHDPADYEFIADLLARSLPAEVQLDAVGFSLGGKLLLQLAAEQPDRFRRVVVGGVGGNVFRPEAGEAVSRGLLEGLPDDSPAVLRAVVEEARASGNDLHGLAAVIRRPPRPVAPEALSAIRADVLLVVGTDDGIAGAPEALTAALPEAETAVIEGLDHLSTHTSAEFQNRAAAFVLAGPQ